MKKLSKEKRANIYLQMAEFYELNKNKKNSICLDLECIYNGDKCRDWTQEFTINYSTIYTEILTLFPEIQNFVDGNEESFNNEIRIMSLLFAHQMAKNP